MTIRSLFLAFATAVLVSEARAGVQNVAQQRCITGLNSAGAGVAKMITREISRCVEAACKSNLPAGGTAQQCLTADSRGRVARAAAKVVLVESKSCLIAPDFGASSAAVVNAAMQAMPRASYAFGNDLDAAIIRRTVDVRGASCQQTVAKGLAKLASVRFKAFDACKKTGLAQGTIQSTAGLVDCYINVSVANVVMAVGTTVAKRCAGVNLASAFPGQCANASEATLVSCLEPHVDCAVCRALDGADLLGTECTHYVDGVATALCDLPVPSTQSVARQWDEELLAAIRIDFARPPVHARNLFHFAAAVWDAWAAYDPVADGYITTEKLASPDPDRDRAATISFAAYRLLRHRFQNAPQAATSLARFDALMHTLGFDVNYTMKTGSTPAALGNRIGQAVIDYGLADGANEAGNYADPSYTAVNEPLIVKLPGTTMLDPNRWQPLALDLIIDQSGNPIPSKIQSYVGSGWGSVTPFAISLASLLPSPPPRLHDPVTDADFKQQALEVIRFSSRLTPDDPVTMDISPASLGDNPLGTNAGTGYPSNPITGQPYVPQIVKRGDFGRVLAEFWADGPTSETPPGHWNVLANYVSDNTATKRVGGTGPVVGDLEWDVKLYLALNGAVHDAAVGCWGTKRVYDSVRPISMIRYMGGIGQSSDLGGPSYDPDGLPLETGVVEVITPASSAPGERHEALAAFLGEIAVYSWPGEPAIPATQYSGVHWVRAKNWVAYQRKTFVTPPFAAYTSGHSTYSRSAAEILTAFTGSPYFPGGLGEFVALQNQYLVFEDGPSTDVRLQWATYYDAADQAGQSRLWGGIHIVADDFGGRMMGAAIGPMVWAKAQTYYDGTAVLTSTPKTIPIPK